jgi:uncharacterized protein YbjQ (UPF0145 family)
MNYDKCPNCGKPLKGIFSAVLVSQSRTDFINKNTQTNKDAYCNLCSIAPLEVIAKNYRAQKSEIEKRLLQIIHVVPVLTSPAPVSWQYEAIDMVTSQTTSGTGFITELSRSFNDFFGQGSETTNKKISDATLFCKSDIRIQCIKKGGNAVVSTDIDYNEIGSGSTNMLMVCMAGTAIKVTDLSGFKPDIRNYIKEITELSISLEAISELREP